MKKASLTLMDQPLYEEVSRSIDEKYYFCDNNIMKDILLSSAVLLGSLLWGGVAYACDMHGAGYGGFGFSTDSWRAYSPKASITDPAFDAQSFETPLLSEPKAKVKEKPSFANAAHMAALKAQSRLTKKDDGTKLDDKSDVKKTALNSDR